MLKSPRRHRFPWGFNDCVVSSIEHLTYMLLYGLLHHYFESLAIDRNDIDALDWSFYYYIAISRNL